MLAGIRWANLNQDQPFVDVWPDFKLETPRDIEHLAQRASSEFTIHSPKHIRLWLAPRPIREEFLVPVGG